MAAFRRPRQPSVTNETFGRLSVTIRELICVRARFRRDPRAFARPTENDIINTSRSSCERAPVVSSYSGPVESRGMATVLA